MNNWKNISLGVLVIIVIIGIVYFVFHGTSPATQQAATANQQATTTPQVQAQDVSVGTGTEATPGSYVSVLYVGKLSDGTVFDSSEAHGNQPLVFQLGTQGLIPGFQIGVNGMKVGGERVMAIPAELGYGTEAKLDANNKVIIPANSTLIFDVKLVNVSATAPAAATTPTAPAKSTSATR